MPAATESDSPAVQTTSPLSSGANGLAEEGNTRRNRGECQPWIRRQRVLMFVAIGVVLAISGEFFVWGHYREKEKTARRHWLQLRRDGQALRQAKPSLTPETMRALREDLAAAELEARRWESDFAPSWSPNSAVPATRADAFFELAQFVERMRAEGKAAGVKIGPSERFGFSEYAHAGPDPDEIAQVARARAATEFLLHALYESRPLELLSVSRARIATDAKPASAAVDRFEWPDAWSLRRRGITESQTLRVAFVGETVSLREFVNTLAAAPGMIVIRSVEVGPATESTSEAGEKTVHLEMVAAMVPKSVSRFTVVVEVVESVAASKTKESR